MAVDDIRPARSQNNMIAVKEELPPSESVGSKNTIHSGHFMVSRVHDVNNDDDEEESVSPFSDDTKGFDFLTANKETSTTYNFIKTSSSSVSKEDASLSKLFECMTLAYSGKITSPRWKQFRGLHLSQWQRIRLNNLIWREWHAQYILSKLPMYCQFATPLADDIHSKPEAVVLEGKYWKRKLGTVTAEYKKWRRYFKRQQQSLNFQDTKALNERELLDRVGEVTFIPHSSASYMSSTDLNLLQSDMSMMDMDFTNELFASLNQPFAFPNPREFSQLGCGDLIQPGLVQLQPNLEEFMDIDSMQGQDTDHPRALPSSVAPLVLTTSTSSPRKPATHLLVEFFGARTPSTYSSTFMSDTAPSVEIAQGSMQSTDLSLVDYLTSSSPTSNIAPASISSTTEIIGSTTPPVLSGGNANTTAFLTSNLGSSQNITLQLTADGQYQLDPSTIFLGTSVTPGLSSVSQQTFTILPTGVYNNIQGVASSQQKPVTATSTISSSELLAQLLQQQQQQQQQQHQHPAEVTVAPKKQYRSQQSPTPIQPAPSLSQQQHHHQQLHHQQQQLFQQPVSSQTPLLAQSLTVHPHQQQQQAQILIQPDQSQRKSTKINKLIKNSGSSDSGSSGGATALLSKLMGSSSNTNNIKKKDGPFAVPTAKSVITPRKHRTIAPAPSPPTSPPQQNTVVTPSPSSQASYLAELLKNGTYPGALINVKKEPQLPSTPIKTTTNVYKQIRASQSPSYTQHVVTVATTGHIQTNLSMLAGATGSPVNVTSITTPGLGASSSVSPIVVKETSVRFAHDSEPSASSSTINLLSSPVSSPQHVKRSPSPSPSMDTSLSLDPVSPFPDMPMSPSTLGAPDSPGSGDSAFPKDNRRAAHLSAEQKRRCNLKTGFDMLQQLVPSLSNNPKVSKATMLQKTAEYCKKLKAERSQMQKEAAILKQEIDSLNSAISVVQSQLPETGVPVTRQRKDQMREMFDEYVRTRTKENWKFWIFSVIMNTLYDSYCNTVSIASMEEMCRTSMTWLDQSCSLVTLRPNVLNALRRLSTSTSILTEPQKVKEQALQAVARQSRSSSSNNMMAK